MVYVNENYYEAIRGNNLRTAWAGTITLTSGDVITFDMSNIKSGTGELTMRCSSDSSIDLGGGYASELVLSLKKMDLDRYLLIDGVINLTASIIQHVEYSTWGDVADYTWGSMGTDHWGDTEGDVVYTIPMGLYIIKEAMRTSDSVKITAYDNMIKLDKDLPATFTEATRTAYDWLMIACTDCGLTLGMNRNDVRELPNGNRTMELANVNTEVKTYRDMIIQLAVAVCAVAVIDRAGRLVLTPYTMYLADEIGADFRYSSEFSEYQSYYTGLYATFQDENVTEYHRNVPEVDDTGLVIDIGANSFLQITDETKRKNAGQEIIDGLAGIKFVPFNVTMPFNPAYEPMDALKFVDNQTEVEDIAPITKVVFKINDKMQILCVGENPALNEVSTRENKAIDRISDDTYSGDVFWMAMDNAPVGSAATIVADTPTKIGEALFYAPKDKSMLAIAYTATFDLDDIALVRVYVYVDATLVYVTEDNLFPNENTLTVTTGYELDGKGSHSSSVYLELTDGTDPYEDVDTENF